MATEVKLGRVLRNVRERDTAVDLEEWRRGWRHVLMLPWGKQEALCSELSIPLSQLKQFGDVSWAADIARRVAGAQRDQKLARLREEEAALAATLRAQKAQLEV